MTDIPPNFNPETAPPTLTIDWDAYLPFLEDENISEEEKHELIEALWSIMVSFVDLGFGVHPVQQVCGKDVSLADLSAADVLKSGAKSPQPNQTETVYQSAASERSPHASK